MGLIYHAALENSLIMFYGFSSVKKAPFPVFCRFVDVSKIKLTIFLNQLVATNRRIVTVLDNLALHFSII